MGTPFSLNVFDQKPFHSDSLEEKMKNLIQVKGNILSFRCLGFGGDSDNVYK